MEGRKWDFLTVVDSAIFGDVMSSMWQIGVHGRDDMKNLHRATSTSYAKTLGGGQVQ